VSDPDYEIVAASNVQACSPHLGVTGFDSVVRPSHFYLNFLFDRRWCTSRWPTFLGITIAQIMRSLI
jgi:hypothetical protein